MCLILLTGPRDTSPTRWFFKSIQQYGHFGCLVASSFLIVEAGITTRLLGRRNYLPGNMGRGGKLYPEMETGEGNWGRFHCHALLDVR